MRFPLVAVVALAILTGTAQAETVDTAVAGSISCGHANQGRLYGGVALPAVGPGYVSPEPWRSRELRYGTVEMIGLIQRAAALVALRHPGAVLGVADLSRPDGGACPRHRSHQSGRDVDLLYYALDTDGRPMPPDEVMPYYTSRGIAKWARSPVWRRQIAERRFDVARNWSLIKVLLTDPAVDIERIFVSPRIERWLIDHARALGEDEELIRAAQRALHRPRGGDAHNDHMHVRIGCSADDVALGRCRTENGRGRRWRLACPRPPRTDRRDVM